MHASGTAEAVMRVPITATQSRNYPWFFLAVLTVAHLTAVLDRIAISLLVEPIKADLHLSDTQVSLLQGLALTLGLVGALIPMGILVDRLNRTKLLAAAVCFWSVMTGLCGLASGFWTLFLARMGVGVGEASLMPAGSSLISDVFEKRRLGVALSIFTTGGAIGTGLSFVVGGLVIGAVSSQGDVHLPLMGLLHPWQLTVLLMALPGMLMAVVMSFMPNPQRGRPAPPAAVEAPWRVLRAFYGTNKRLLFSHHAALGCSALVLLGAYSWVAPLFSRVHGWDAATIGVTTGSAVALVTPVGLLGGGLLGDSLLKRGAHMRLTVCAVSVACGGVCGLLYPLVADAWLAVVFYSGMTLFVTLPHGVGIAALQHIVPDEVRGRISAIFYLMVTTIQVVGPTAIAVIADTFFPFETGIRYATAIVVPAVLFAAALLYLWAIPPYRRFQDA